MKIQELAIIFVIIILPISILLSEYTQFQIQTIKTQTEYDSKLTTATYDAIKAFQLNAQNETYSGLANERVKEIERSVKSFRNSLISSFKLNGYTEDELNNYIPALVYTLYDGLYIYSPYENTNYRYEYENNPYTGEPEYITDASGNKIPTEGNGEQLYGLKPYISYSCRYKKGNIDVVITYALDNYITVQGMLGTEYINRGGYLIDNIEVKEDGVWYNGVEIETEQLKENVIGNTYQYVKRNGVKYYLIGNQIVSISNGDVTKLYSEGDEEYTKWVNLINNNTYAQQYYKDASEFTRWFRYETNLGDLRYCDAYDEVIDENTGETRITPIWDENDTEIFDFNTETDTKDNIENELSNFNQHRLAVIRHKIETNLAIAISNYNEYATGKEVRNVFQLPQIKEDEWEHITHNISLISFLQGLPIGGKIYNGYTIVTNSESKEVVLEQNIYILGKDENYHKIGDNNFVVEDSGAYRNEDGKAIGAGRLNTDFKRQSLTNSEGNQRYYYPLRAYNASYNSIVMQNDVTTYDDIYEYINEQGDVDLKKAFYTALGRERYGMKLSVMPETYTVTYEGNGGVVAKRFDIKTHGVDLTLAPKPTRSGYEFVMWNTKVDGTGDSYGPGEKYSKDENVTLYAVWKQRLGPLTVTYELNGGTWTNPYPTMLPVTPGSIITLPSAPIRSGYKFEGWVLVIQSLISSPVFPAGSRYTVNEDITFKAKWVEVSTM